MVKFDKDYYEFKYVDDNGNETVTRFRAETLPEMLKQYEYFLIAATFDIKSKSLELVDDCR